MTERIFVVQSLLFSVSLLFLINLLAHDCEGALGGGLRALPNILGNPRKGGQGYVFIN